MNNMFKSNMNTNTEKSNIKYICKFYLQIEGDKEFQVIKRIIGAKGNNLKRIIDYCSKGPGGVYMPDAIKLKLKGVGIVIFLVNILFADFELEKLFNKGKSFSI